jgi:hypothetical protein
VAKKNYNFPHVFCSGQRSLLKERSQSTDNMLEEDVCLAYGKKPNKILKIFQCFVKHCSCHVQGGDLRGNSEANI